MGLLDRARGVIRQKSLPQRVWNLAPAFSIPKLRISASGNSGDIYEQAVGTTVAGFFAGIPHIYSASPGSECPTQFKRRKQAVPGICCYVPNRES